MKNLSYQTYSDYYASKCKKCLGEKRVLVNNIWTVCICQNSATLKFKFEQFDVNPSSLKYKTWDDFDGFIDGRQVISMESWVSAKRNALKYCFGTDDINVIENRKNSLIVHKHRHDGQNVIIVGHPQSGRSLIASLIIKEVAHACRLHNLDLSFKCIKAYDLFVAARWDNEKSLDYPLLEELEDVDFLVIDSVGVMPTKGHHTNPPDHNTMNTLFGNRLKFGLPTIVVCSPVFWTNCVNPNMRIVNDISSLWGDPFIDLVLKPSNVVIELKKI